MQPKSSSILLSLHHRGTGSFKQSAREEENKHPSQNIAFHAGLTCSSLEPKNSQEIRTEHAAGRKIIPGLARRKRGKETRAKRNQEAPQAVYASKGRNSSRDPAGNVED